MYCTACGKENKDTDTVCAGCGAALGGTGEESSSTVTHVTVNNAPAAGNGLGTAGFVLALIGFFTSWIPVVGWLVWLLGAILSFVGVLKPRKGLAIAGLVISFIDVIILMGVASCTSSVVGMAM